MADGVGFEPTIRGYRIHAFQACAFSHSATRPRRGIMPKAVPRCNVESASVTLLLVRSAISRRGYSDGSPPTDRR